MSLYHNLAAAKNGLRASKDHYETTRAICEMRVQTTGKNAEDRKRELTIALASDEDYIAALDDLRDAEAELDQAQAAIDAAEADRRDREWSIRARLAEALGRVNVTTEDDIPDWLNDQRAVQRAKAQMAELYS